MKKLFLIFIFLSSAIYGQPKLRSDSSPNPLQIKPTISVMPDTGKTVVVSYLYRIPYKLLVFEKAGSDYKASMRIMVEVLKGDELVVRDFQDKKVTVDNFEITQNRDASVQGIIRFKLQDDEYEMNGVLNDLNSEKEIKLAPEHVTTSEAIESGIYSPVVVDFSDSDCNGKQFPLIVNHSGGIPFSSKEFQLVIPVADTSVQKLTIELKNNDDEAVTKTTAESYVSGLTISECNNKLYLGKVEFNQQTKNFVLNNFSTQLNEGKVKLSIKENEDSKSSEFTLQVDWIDKPFSLRNPELAIEMLQYIESENVVDKMLDADEDDYKDELNEYWKKYDPTPNTKYNELMEEYYSRIDYAASKFRNLTKRNGISTDRGKVYIKYGQPDKIERSSDEYGYVVETWIYGNNKQKFVFVDKDGTGNFILVEG
ncbi:MAG: GWxTD domain-containing protein [Ignavibacteriaceae bacterium]